MQSGDPAVGGPPAPEDPPGLTESSPVIDPAPPPPVASGAVIGGYRVEALLGRGGMGVVYRAEQIQLGRPVALKLMAPEVAQDPG
ncbi:MAG: hypothetical protein ACR2ML_02235, partial [Solirubrobacteraceae bacterium]